MKNSDIEELREYRRLKSAGRLYVVPEGMNDGDTIWFCNPLTRRVTSHMIIEWVILSGRLWGKISNEGEDLLFALSDIDLHVFRTKEEAERQAELFEKELMPEPETEEEKDSDNPDGKNL